MFAFFSSLKKYLTGILGVFLLIACVVATIVLLRTPVFEAEARINIPEMNTGATLKKQAKKTASSSSLPNSVATTHSSTLQTAVAILQGNVLAEQVITTIGITELFSDLAQSTKGEAILLSHALAAFQQQLTVTLMKESRIIKITFQHTDPEMTVQVVETLLRLFQEKYTQSQSPEIVLHNEQLLLSRQEMHQAARSLSMYKQRNPLLLEEEQGRATEEYNKVKTLLSEAQEELDEQLRQLNALEEQFAERITPDNPNSGQVGQEEQEKLTTFLEEGKDLIRLKNYEQELIKKYGQGSSGDRLINNVRLQIASLQNTLYGEAGIPETEHEQLEAMADQIVLARKNYHEQQKRIDLLQRGISQLEDTLQRIAEQGAILAQLRQQAETTRERYTTLVAQLETEQQFRQAFQQIRIVDQPVLPIVPIEPNKKSAFFWALISGVIGSLLYGTFQLVRHRNNSRTL